MMNNSIYSFKKEESKEVREYKNKINWSIRYLIKKNDNPSKLTSCKCKGNFDK
jgi:hypothetical protein